MAPQSGELDLSRLLATLQPRLQEGEYVFATLDLQSTAIAACRAVAVGTFLEAEGLTLILPTTYTELPAGTECSAPQRMITLECHSSLEAIGLTYRVSQKLAALDISCNVVAAYFHDHIFVSIEKAEMAVRALQELQAESKSMAESQWRHACK